MRPAVCPTVFKCQQRLPASATLHVPLILSQLLVQECAACVLWHAGPMPRLDSDTANLKMYSVSTAHRVARVLSINVGQLCVRVR